MLMAVMEGVVCDLYYCRNPETLPWVASLLSLSLNYLVQYCQLHIQGIAECRPFAYTP